MNSIFKNTGVWGCLIGISVLMIACGNNDNEMDASGTFESVEVMAASEVTGKVISLQSAEGLEVQEGDLLGVIESMKQIHEIESDCDGIVRAILVESGQAVEYGTPLFVIE